MIPNKGNLTGNDDPPGAVAILGAEVHPNTLCVGLLKIPEEGLE